MFTNICCLILLELWTLLNNSHRFCGRANPSKIFWINENFINMQCFVFSAHNTQDVICTVPWEAIDFVQTIPGSCRCWNCFTSGRALLQFQLETLASVKLLWKMSEATQPALSKCHMTGWCWWLNKFFPDFSYPITSERRDEGNNHIVTCLHNITCQCFARNIFIPSTDPILTIIVGFCDS